MMGVSKEAAELMEFTKYKTGLELDVQKDSSLNVDGIAEDHVRDEGRYVIKYRPDLDGYLDHIVCHECGHILRFWLAEPKDRKVPGSNLKTKAVAIKQLSSEYAAMAQRGVPLDYIVQAFDFLYNGLLTQLTNIPVDISIEQWLEKEYPAIKGFQKEALIRQVKDAYKVLKPRVKSITPETLYEASVAMNYAFAKAMGSLIGRRTTKPYANTPYQKVGKKLLSYLQENDDSHVGDRYAIDKWAEVLGISGWYEWHDYETINRKTNPLINTVPR